MTLYFAHISDTHIGPTPDLTRHGHVSYACTQRLIEILPRKDRWTIKKNTLQTITLQNSIRPISGKRIFGIPDNHTFAMSFPSARLDLGSHQT